MIRIFSSPVEVRLTIVDAMVVENLDKKNQKIMSVGE